MDLLLISSRNVHKIQEFREILKDRFEVVGLERLPELEPVEETGATFEENAMLKAVAASRLFDGWVLADDSGLEVAVLNREPGVRSARYAGENATDAENNALLLNKLAGVQEHHRLACFRCVLAAALHGQIKQMFSGSVEGIIAKSPRGKNGFGYDPLFIPNGYDQTFAELDLSIKNNISHRAQALKQLQFWMC